MDGTQGTATAAVIGARLGALARRLDALPAETPLTGWSSLAAGEYRAAVHRLLAATDQAGEQLRRAERLAGTSG